MKSLRLNELMRNAFVRAVMDDVPQIDYEAQAESLVQAEAVSKMPEKVRQVYDDPALRRFLFTSCFCTPPGLDNVYVYGESLEELSEGSVKVLKTIAEKARAQTAERKVLLDKIRKVSRAYGTREALVKAMPEFEKYLPVNPETPSRLLPVVQNVVSDFVKAGWPKDRK